MIFLPLLSSFAYEGPENSNGTEIKWTHQLLTYAYDVNLLGNNIRGIGYVDVV
jgi:hypothetical protein